MEGIGHPPNKHYCLKLPELPKVSERMLLQMPVHFELLYYDSLHYVTSYNYIIWETVGRVCSTFEPCHIITVDYSCINYACIIMPSI